MSEVKDGGAAFPVHGGYPGDDPRNQILGGGLTIRDWFAGQALAGVIPLCKDDTLAPGDSRAAVFAFKAYAIADAMLAERALAAREGRDG